MTYLKRAWISLSAYDMENKGQLSWLDRELNFTLLILLFKKFSKSDFCLNQGQFGDLLAKSGELVSPKESQINWNCGLETADEVVTLIHFI